MDILEAIKARHSVRNYIDKAISADIINTLQNKIDECNKLGKLKIQLVTNEPKAFTGIMSYGKFSGVRNYFVMVGEKAPDLDERIGYYGEQLVLLAQTLGLNTCWVGLTYRKVADVYEVDANEKIVCVIALGYGATSGIGHKIKNIDQVSNFSEQTPSWFASGVRAALLAPTAVNQQRFYFQYLGNTDGKHQVKAIRKCSMVGYTKLDLGIAKLHFEIGAGKDNFEWCNE